MRRQNPNTWRKKISYRLKCAKKRKPEDTTGVTLKIRQQKWKCIVCDSKKSTFLKSIKRKNNFHNL